MTLHGPAAAEFRALIAANEASLDLGIMRGPRWTGERWPTFDEDVAAAKAIITAK